ncbi:MAG TPA: PIG-L family deacetylase [Gemmatimonadales bacterium]|nr:PIG-L family deacetylase [Gemmatimonadales bacterium]
MALEHALRRLGHAKRVLVIGAHPDDEDTELITLLTRGEGADAAYLSLNRGEGGQNLIGPELGDALGVLRTEELLAARRLDGARQFFTRAYDFGYSKSIDDTWAQWPRDTLLGDVVRVIRTFQPQVIVSIFGGTPRDGHGQHQAAGWLAHEAFRVAGDPRAFPEQLREGLAPWLPQRLFRSARFDTVATTLTADGGRLDPSTGQTFHQTAMASRSLHRSQDMGQLQEIGPSPVRLALVEDRPGRGSGGIFAGIDTTLASAVGPAARSALDDYARRVAALRGGTPTLAQVRAASAALLRAEKQVPGSAELASERRALDQVGQVVAGLLVDAYADDSLLVPGGAATVTFEAYNSSRERMVVRLGLAGIADTTLEVALAPGERVRLPVRIAVPASAPFTAVPQHRASRDMTLYERDGWLGVPADGEPVSALVARYTLPGDGPLGPLERPVAFRWNEQSRGEVRTPVAVVPRVDVSIVPAEVPWRIGDRAARTYRVRLRHAVHDSTRGTVRLELPRGWPTVAPQRFALSGAGDTQELVFAVRPPASLAVDGRVVRAVAEDEAGRAYDIGRQVVSYPHIRPRSSFHPAESRVTPMDLTLPLRRRIGYVRGAADAVPEALAAAGFPVEVIERGTIGRADLARYDAIVVGPRAYETDAALPGATARLRAWVRTGGLLLVQYQQYDYFLGGYAPDRLGVWARLFGSADGGQAMGPGVKPPYSPSLLGGHDRVTDERAPVTVLRPDDPVLRAPNRIGPADWDGWVQERGLYFAREWGPAFRPVLAMHDPGEPPREGGLLIARDGKGVYVYTGLSFFRQLPAGVPGAFRLFANLLAVK